MTGQIGVQARSARERRRLEFVKFVAAGGVAAGVNVLSRFLFDMFMSYEAAIIPAYLCGMTTAYLLTKFLVFAPSSLSARHEFVRFGIVNLVALCQVWLVSVGLAEWLFPVIGFTFQPHAVAHAIGVVIPVFTSYLGHKHFSFERKQTNR